MVDVAVLRPRLRRVCRLARQHRGSAHARRRCDLPRDHVLDLWVEPDWTCSRKDEYELGLAVVQGRYDPATAAWIESVADEVELVIGSWGSPFCDGWENFRPDPGWPLPSLPS